MNTEASIFINKQPVFGKKTERVDITCTPESVHVLDTESALGYCLSETLGALGIAHAKITDLDLLTIGSKEIVHDNLKNFRVRLGQIASESAQLLRVTRPVYRQRIGAALDELAQTLPTVLDDMHTFLDPVETIVSKICTDIPPTPIQTQRGRAPLLEAEYENRVAALSRKPQRYDSARFPYKTVELNLYRGDVDHITALALLDRTSLASQIRAALAWYSTLRTNDPELEAKIAKRSEEFRNES